MNLKYLLWKVGLEKLQAALDAGREAGSERAGAVRVGEVGEAAAARAGEVCTREEVCMMERVLAEAVLVPVPIHHNVKSQKAQNPRIYLAYLQYKNIFT